ncbi:MAG: hypothetical protein QW478_11350 [Candidatus Micrarchaeaceae archaeon]
MIENVINSLVKLGYMVLPFTTSINVSEKHELFRRAVREFMEKHVALM